MEPVFLCFILSKDNGTCFFSSYFQKFDPEKVRIMMELATMKKRQEKVEQKMVRIYIRLAPVLKTIFPLCVISYTCS